MLCATIYTLLLIIWRLALQTPLYEGYWQLQVSQIFGSWSYLPLFPLIFLFLWAGSRRAIIILLLPLLLFATEYGQQYLPNWHLTENTTDSVQLRVLSWNTLFMTDPERIFIDGLNELAPDVIALQEFSYDLIRLIEDELGQRYPYTHFYQPGGWSSLGLVSRYPIMEVEVLNMRAGCRCQKAILDVNGRLITVINVHSLSPSYRIKFDNPGVTHFNTEYQDYFFDALLPQVEAIPEPLILLGDFNTTERQPNYQRLSKHLHDSFAEVGWGMGYTYPDYGTFQWSFYRWFGFEGGLFPLIRIDHVFHNDAWEARSARTLSFGDSDHRAILVDLRLVE